MFIRIYVFALALSAAAAAALFLTGNFTELTITVFGFLFSTLVFMGMVAVLPWAVDKQFTPRY